MVMALTTNLVRVIPMLLIRKRITNRFVQSFLYYVPYVTLAVMTFPAILNSTGSVISGALALIVALIMALCGLGLLPVAIGSCIVVLICELI